MSISIPVNTEALWFWGRIGFFDDFINNPFDGIDIILTIPVLLVEVFEGLCQGWEDDVGLPFGLCPPISRRNAFKNWVFGFHKNYPQGFPLRTDDTSDVGILYVVRASGW